MPGVHIVCIAMGFLFLTSTLWTDVSAECSDPVIYKLSDIQALIANLTTQVQRQAEQLEELHRLRCLGPVHNRI